MRGGEEEGGRDPPGQPVVGEPGLLLPHGGLPLLR
jgi:hypothetical protein